MLQLQNGVFYLKLLVLTVCFGAICVHCDLCATAMFVYDSVAISPCVNISRNTGELGACKSSIQLDIATVRMA